MKNTNLRLTANAYKLLASKFVIKHSSGNRRWWEIQIFCVNTSSTRWHSCTYLSVLLVPGCNLYRRNGNILETLALVALLVITIGAFWARMCRTYDCLNCGKKSVHIFMKIA
jgi:hypothetical protein